MNLKSSVKELKGIGEKTSVPLQKQEFLILKTSCGIIPGPMRLMSLQLKWMKWKIAGNMQSMPGCSRFPL